MDWLREHMWETWLAVSAVLLVAEMFSLDLVLAMLALGALVGMVAALVGLPVLVQFGAAGVTALAAIWLLRPSMAKRLHGGPELSLGHGKLVGREAEVTTDITPSTVGRVLLAGESWSAIPYDETATILAGEHVEVMEIRGATVVVYPVARLNP